jgi:hypothetical protein
MSKPSRTRKLTLHRETLQPLTPNALRLVAGGKPGCYGNGTSCNPYQR